MASTMTLARLQSGTYGSKQLADRLRRNLAKLDLDVYRDARFQHRECPACYYLRSERIAGQGFTDWRCSSCGTQQQPWSNTNHPHFCNDCCDLHGMCCRCGGDLDLAERKSLKAPKRRTR